MGKFMILPSLLMAFASCTVSAKDDTGNGTDKYDSQLLQSGVAAPDFTIVNDTHPEGFALSSLRGKTVVLEFWASWCPDCRKITDTMVSLHNTYAPKGVEFVGVSFDTDKTTWQNYVESHGMVWTQYSELKKWKKETTIDTLYKVNWIPTMYLIGKDGRIVLGTVDINKLSKALEEAAQ